MPGALRPRSSTLPFAAGLSLVMGLAGCYFDFSEVDAGGDPNAIDATIRYDAFVPLDVDYQFLSETGLYSDMATRTLADGVMAFEPEFHLWSDAAEKERYIWMPPGTQIDTSDMDRWRFPPGTKIWKNFTQPGIDLVETRFIMRLGFNAPQVFMTSFVWNESETDANRTPPGLAIALDGVTECPDFPTEGNPSPNCHFVPPEDDCIRCHDGQEHNNLGFQAVQLSYDNPDGVDLADLVAMDLLTDPPPDGEIYPVPGAGLARDAVGYLHANCGHCHNRDLDAGDTCYGLTSFEARVYVGNQTIEETPVYLSGVNTLITFWDQQEGNSFGVNCRITPGNPDGSAIFRRMSSRDGWIRPHAQMPPEFTAQIDSAGVALIESWISGIAEPAAGTCTPDPPI